MSIETVKAIRAIDFHSHFVHGHPSDSKETREYKCNLPFILMMNEVCNVEKTICSTFASVLDPKAVCAENEYMYSLCDMVPSLYQWVVIDPRIEKSFEQAEEMLGTRKCLGIKLHPPLHGYSTREYGDRLFGFADERHAVVQIHPEEEGDYYLPWADKYRHMTLDIAHLGGAGHIRPIVEAKYHNVITDTSGSASIFNEIVEAACKAGCADRILYGSDTYDVGFQRGRIEYAAISDREKEMILRENALRIFPKLAE